MINKLIYNIGHSTRSFEEFLQLLNSFDIKCVADIRSYPGSRRYPQFNKEELSRSLAEAEIIYQHLPELGGRRKVSKDSKNVAWRNPSFRGYADYMETDEFKDGIIRLEKIAIQNITAFMCSEAVWWRCHRSMVSDYMKWKGWNVQHILTINKSEEHPFTKPARITDGGLDYSGSLLSH